VYDSNYQAIVAKISVSMADFLSTPHAAQIVLGFD
jgi:hypothetical protein